MTFGIPRKEKAVSIVELLCALVRRTVDGTPLPPAVRENVTADVLPTLYALAKHHDLAHLVGAALTQEQLLPSDGEVSAKFEKQTMLALFRYERSRETLAELCAVLGEARVCHMPLKGSVLRDLYPEPWMRTSCDIDILVKPEELEAAEQALLSHGYRADKKGDHDLSLFSPGGVHVELHYALMGERDLPATAPVLSEAWQRSAPCDAQPYRYVMPDGLFYFYHLAHMAKHVINGGCGLRPFLDLYILFRVEHSEDERRTLLEMGGLSRFADVAERLSRVLFDTASHDEQTLTLARYVLGGGVYGNMDNRVALGQSKKGGKLRYLLSRVFLPYATLKYYYPVLQKHRWLMPVCQVRRWGRIIFRGGLRRSANEIRTIGQTPKKETADTGRLLRDLGL